MREYEFFCVCLSDQSLGRWRVALLVAPREQPSVSITCKTPLINSPALDPTVGLCLGPYGGPREVSVSYERGTPVQHLEANYHPSVSITCELRLVNYCIYFHTQKLTNPGDTGYSPCPD